MRIISKKPLREFWAMHPDAKAPLQTWYQKVKRAQWTSWPEVKEDHASASTLQNDRVVFNIGGGKYRLVVAVKYEGPNGKIFVRFIGTHQQYDEIDAETV